MEGTKVNKDLAQAWTLDSELRGPGSWEKDKARNPWEGDKGTTEGNNRAGSEEAASQW